MMRASVKLSERELLALDRAREKAKLIAWLRAEAASRDGEMAWYVARTRWRADAVCAELKASGVEAVCPMERQWRRYPRSNRRYSVDKPLLGNYLLVHLLKAESAWVGMLTFDGVECLQGTGERPVAVNAADMRTIGEMLENAGKASMPASTGLAVGDRVLHPVGAFAELMGSVVEIDAKRRAALVSTVLFGREMSTWCGIDDLERLT